MAKRKSSNSRRKQKAESQNTDDTNFEEVEGGLDADLNEVFTGPQTTGRMLAVTLEKPTSAARKTLLSQVAGLSGLGKSKDAVCSSADFGDDGIDEAQAADAEVIMLEDLGIALLNGDVEQNQMLSTTAAAPGDNVILEPEYINYALGFADAMDVGPAEGTAGLDDPGYDEINSGGMDLDTMRTMIRLLSRMVENADAGAAANGSPTAASTCFRDSAQLTWGLIATGSGSSHATGAGIRVAVLDSGMDLGHPDYRNRAIRHAVFQTSAVDPDINDVNGHGTHCIGTACGPQRSHFGPRYGVAPEADIYAGKVLAQVPGRNTASGGDFAILRGIQWALSNGCPIISMSLGSAATGSFSQAYEQAAKRALGMGSLIIAATGNDSARPGHVAPVGRPANCPSILGVAAVDNCLKVASFSNGRKFSHAGSEVNISGPGVHVISSVPRHRGNVGRMNGTSMATPHVAGIAALVAQQTNLRGVPLYKELRRRARRLGHMNDYGNGLVHF